MNKLKREIVVEISQDYTFVVILVTVCVNFCTDTIVSHLVPCYYVTIPGLLDSIVDVSYISRRQCR